MSVKVIGAGLAGCEAALFLAKHKIKVVLCEMKPEAFSEAHKNPLFGELVCSNSLKSRKISTASGLLKKELEMLDSELMKTANNCAVPAGNSLSVDRALFSEELSLKIASSPFIETKTMVFKKFSKKSEEIILYATGPLTHQSLLESFMKELASENLYFYDAIAPIIDGKSIDPLKSFYGSRYEPENKDYLNIPLTKEEYYTFIEDLLSAEAVPLHSFEKFYEGCLPIEEMARRGKETLAFGPLKPVGFDIKLSGVRPYAIVQLRRENISGDAFNMVGFQTKMTQEAQRKVFRKFPALQKAEFLRYGSIHKNSFLKSPALLNRNFSLKDGENIFFAGQLTGVEGYVESIASGLYSAIQIVNRLGIEKYEPFPETMLLPNLMKYAVNPENCMNFQPMGANLGLLPPIPGKNSRKTRYQLYADRSLQALAKWFETSPLIKIIND